MRPILALTLALTLAAAVRAVAGPAAPVTAPEIARIEVGVFCALQAMDRMPAPGTDAGWIHVPTGEVGFHWPDQRVVPAAIGIAFGVKATGIPGWASTAAEARVFRPGRKVPEAWKTGISDAGASIAFFRFDKEAELDPGLWVFEVWDGDRRLYRVEFDVVPAAGLPEIVEACQAVS